MEILFTCDSESPSSCTAWDFRTSTNLMTYKGGGVIQSHALEMVGLDFVLGANSTKPLLHVWPINHQDQITSVRFVLPGRANAMALSPDGIYLVVGIQETLYIWHLSTGRMLNTITKHYQSINCIRFTDDSSHFISAGQDGSVLVWNLSVAVGRGDDNETPRFSFTDHGLPVKDVYIGGAGMRSYAFTASLDRTCKVYDLSCGMLLLNVVFPEGLCCVISNQMETGVFVGTSEGSIYEFSTDSLPRTKEYHIETNYTNKFKGHKDGTSINCMVISADGQTLISGGQDHQVCVWNIPSRQLLKTINLKGPVTNLKLQLAHPDIFNPEHKKHNIFVNNLKRMIDPPETDEDLVIEVLVTEANAYRPENDDFYNYGTANSRINQSSAGAPTKVSDSEEVQELRNEVKKLQSINKQLFEEACSYVLKCNTKT